MQRTEDLPRWPSRANRRRLEDQWLGQLERHGLAAFLPDTRVSAPPHLWKAVDEFNSGAFWKCHETLEEAWLKTPYPLRFFCHSIIKTAVGLYHVSRHNRHGARVKLGDGVRLLQLFLPDFMGIYTDRLHEDAAGWLARVSGEGPVDWSGLEALPFPVIQTVGRSD